MKQQLVMFLKLSTWKSTSTWKQNSWDWGEKRLL